MVIIIAGYTDAINEMLNTNVGLKSRFTEFFDFEDWKPNDCLNFIKDKFKKEGFLFDISNEEELLLIDQFRIMSELPGQGNGRDVIEISKKSIKIRSLRVKDNPEIPKKITIEDINEAISSIIKFRSKETKGKSIDKTIIDLLNSKYNVGNLMEDKMIKNQSKPKFNYNQDLDSKNDKIEDEDISCNKNLETRDEGVTNEEWEELEKAKTDTKNKLDNSTDLEKKKIEDIQFRIRQIRNCPVGFNW